MSIRDRIKEFKRVPASELRASPRNWRRHPLHQQEALQGVLAEIGFADALIARETPDGLELIDGHLRADVMGDEMVPVLVLDVDQAEADKILATLDPLAAMAYADEEQLNTLIANLAFDSPAIIDMLETLSQPINTAIAPIEFPNVDDDLATEYQCPSCGYEWSGQPK